MMQNRSAFAAGLSWFPDYPAGSGRGAALGSLGNATDDARQARADYFGQLAVNGNVAAARILIGGTLNTSGNEAPMWAAWIGAAQQTPLGLQTMQAAQQFGAWWPVGSTDTVDSYPIMRKFVADWAAANPGPAPAIVRTPLATPAPIVPTMPTPVPMPPQYFTPPATQQPTTGLAGPSFGGTTIAGLPVQELAVIAAGAIALTLFLNSRR